jgi:hypothetical protein
MDEDRTPVTQTRQRGLGAGAEHQSYDGAVIEALRAQAGEFGAVEAHVRGGQPLQRRPRDRSVDHRDHDIPGTERALAKAVQAYQVFQ